MARSVGFKIDHSDHCHYCSRGSDHQSGDEAAFTGTEALNRTISYAREDQRRCALMLEMNRVSKLFNPGTVDEKIALMDINLHLKPGIS